MEKESVNLQVSDEVTEPHECYRINHWGAGYFTVNENGNLCIKASPEATHKVDLKLLVDELSHRKIYAPVLIRVMDILRDRIHQLSNSFKTAINQCGYKASYHPLYPVKVNQQREVVEAMLRFGRACGLGLEAGSKAELLVVLALTSDPDTPIVCNGYKDKEFAELVCMAHKMGKNIFPVIEKYSELETFIQLYKETGIIPNLGVRVKLSTKGIGKWAETAGDRSKFGLRIPEVVRAIERLKEEGLLDALQLLHFHIGSQITQIKVVKQALMETTHLFVEMSNMGAKLKYIDVGGGLGVDYHGTLRDSFATVNYSTQEYANDIVYRIMAVCDEYEIEHPTIFSESGRFLSAHYSLLVTNISTSSRLSVGPPERIPIPEDAPTSIQEMSDILEILNENNLLECYHDALQYRSEALNLFNLGYLSLPLRAYMEDTYWQIMHRIQNLASKMEAPPSELAGLEEELTDTYFANFSLFQSLPDAWAIDQVFPIVPIHRLNEEPERNAVLVDLTCDSDGVIKGYVGETAKQKYLPLHALKDDETYYIGIFMIGAYQETLGELHNLFGDTNAVQIEIQGENQYRVVSVTKGDTVKQVLGYVSYNSGELFHKMRLQIEDAVKKGKLSLHEIAPLMEQFEAGLYGYTYFED